MEHVIARFTLLIKRRIGCDSLEQQKSVLP